MKTELQIDHLPGQLLPSERVFLHDALIEKQRVLPRPMIILEVGCGCGAGSTYVMAKALRDLNITTCGVFTCEPDSLRFAQAQTLFRPWPFVHVRNCISSVLIQWVMDCNRVPDFIFFDGPEEPEVAMTDIKELEKKLKRHSMFMMHDWDAGKSTKAHLIRPYMENHPLWERRKSLTSPESVGICLYEFMGGAIA